MISFILGLILGAVVGAFVYRNNFAKANKAVEEAEAEAGELKAKGKAVLDGLKGKK
jgi:hypothetical protein